MASRIEIKIEGEVVFRIHSMDEIEARGLQKIIDKLIEVVEEINDESNIGLIKLRFDGDLIQDFDVLVPGEYIEVSDNAKNMQKM